MTTQTLEMEVQTETEIAQPVAEVAAPVAAKVVAREDKSVRNLIIGAVAMAAFVGLMHALPYAIEVGGRVALGL